MRRACGAGELKTAKIPKLPLAIFPRFCYTGNVTVTRSGEYALQQGRPFPAAVLLANIL